MTDDHGTAVFLERWWILLFYGKTITMPAGKILAQCAKLLHCLI